MAINTKLCDFHYQYKRPQLFLWWTYRLLCGHLQSYYSTYIQYCYIYGIPYRRGLLFPFSPYLPDFNYCSKRGHKSTIPPSDSLYCRFRAIYMSLSKIPQYKAYVFYQLTRPFNKQLRSTITF